MQRNEIATEGGHTTSLNWTKQKTGCVKEKEVD